MARCPNCGQQTLRTEDWACQWCGFPLLNRPYKKIEKTYQQLKDEKLLEAATWAAEPEVEEITEPEPVSEAEAEEVIEPEPEPAPKAEAEEVAEPEPEPVVEVTVSELGSAYATDGAAADAKFLNRVLEVTGIVDKVVINHLNEHYYAMLSSTEEGTLVDVQCTFNRHNADELKQLTAGQTVTIQGRYEGFVTSMVLIDCALAN